MDTVFTFKATKATGEGKDVCYQVNLGVDILEGLTQEQILKHATHDKVVHVQNYKGLLRMSPDIEGATKALQGMGYEDVEVSIYTPSTAPKTLSIEDIKKALISGKLSKADIIKMAEDMVDADDEV